MITLESGNVTVFPFSTLRPTDPERNYLNEYNLSKIVRRLTDKPSYVLSYDGESDTIEFIIEGYYFKASTVVNTIKNYNASDIYAAIYLANGISLDGGDDSTSGTNSFTALKLYLDNELIPDGFKYLHILTKQGLEWSVPSASLLKHNPESLDIDVIQCRV